MQFLKKSVSCNHTLTRRNIIIDNEILALLPTLPPPSPIACAEACASAKPCATAIILAHAVGDMCRQRVRPGKLYVSLPFAVTNRLYCALAISCHVSHITYHPLLITVFVTNHHLFTAIYYLLSIIYHLPPYPIIFSIITAAAPDGSVFPVKIHGIDGTRGTFSKGQFVTHCF